MLSFNKKNTGRFVGAFEILSYPARRRLKSCNHGATPLQLFGWERDTRTLQHQCEFLLGWLTSVICHGSSPPTCVSGDSFRESTRKILRSTQNCGRSLVVSEHIQPVCE